METTSQPLASMAFGRFRVLPHRRELLSAGEPVRVGGRAFDLLMVLIEAFGEVVSKDVLIARVWPDRVVDENALQAQISALRAAFGAERDLIRTVAGRGYQFTGHVQLSAPDEPAGEPEALLAPTNLPEPVFDLIGRNDELRGILGLAVQHRLVTLTGAGGIGKTRLALAAARQLLPQYPMGVWLVEFSPLSDPRSVPAAVATTVGLDIATGEAAAQRVAQALAGRQLLLVLDTCEHVIDAAAELAEAVLRASPTVRILATSREPLGTDGEQIYPVPPLALPADGDDGWQCSAVQLFAARSLASGAHVAKNQTSASIIATICRQLDGVPLAIELAAARAAALGIEEIASRLDDRFDLLTGGRRTALPRHQTLRATLDWSHELLPQSERVILRRLGALAGVFSLEAATAVVGGPDISSSEVVEGLAGLVSKSLVSLDVDRAIERYRLLNTMQAYALEKLNQCGEFEAIARRHAEYYRDFLERAESELEAPHTTEWSDTFGYQIANVRAALNWAALPDGDASLFIALTTAAIPLWMQLSLLEECQSRVQQALAMSEQDTNRDLRREMKLRAAFAASLMYNSSVLEDDVSVSWTRTLEIAEWLADLEYQLRALWGQWSFHMRAGRSRITLPLAERFRAISAEYPDPNLRLIGDRMIGDSEYVRGDLPAARQHFEHVLNHFRMANRRSLIIRYQVDPVAPARALLARTLWLQGLPDTAMRVAEKSVEDAKETNHALSLCYTLALAACPIALWTGNFSAADRHIGTLIDHSRRHGLTFWETWGRYYQAALLIKRGDRVNAPQWLPAVLDKLGKGTSAAQFVTYLGDATEALGRAGQVGEALGIVDDTIARYQDNEDVWLVADLLRSRGELLLLQQAEDAKSVAEVCFRQALDWSRRHGALSLELRAATSLARLLRDRGERTAALTLLQSVRRRFTEGFDTADVKEAETLLEDLLDR